jgi:hypothetical protein
MMEEMMKRCCGEDGRPDFDRMKRFMEECGMSGFSEQHIATMKRFCGGEGMPDFGEMKRFMERCGCVPPGEAEAEKSA